MAVVNRLVCVLIFSIVVMSWLTGCKSGSSDSLCKDRDNFKAIMRARVVLDVLTPELRASIQELAIEDDCYLMKLVKPALVELFNTEEFYKLCPGLSQGPCLTNTPFNLSSIQQREALANTHVRPSIEYIKRTGIKSNNR